jgi:hypothetical protein
MSKYKVTAIYHVEADSPAEALGKIEEEKPSSLYSESQSGQHVTQSPQGGTYL